MPLVARSKTADLAWYRVWYRVTKVHEDGRTDVDVQVFEESVELDSEWTCDGTYLGPDRAEDVGDALMLEMRDPS